MSLRPLASALAELTSADEHGFGGKSAHLGELVHAGIPVPPGFALSTAAFELFVDEAGLRGQIDAALASVRPAELPSAVEASNEIGAAVRAAPVPRAVREAIELQYGALAARAGGGEQAVAVRSSAAGEDGAEATFAGQQQTHLWVDGLDRICTAVRDCWASLYSAEAITYRARLRDTPLPAMGVTVQAMVDAEVAGVLFTCNPVSGDPSMVAVNASWGLGVAVVGGEVTPDDFLVSKVTGETVRARVGSKAIRHVPARGGGTVVEDVPPESRQVACLGDGDLASLVDVARAIERHFGTHQDVEWAIARGRPAPDGLYVLQARPVTTLREPERAETPPSAMSLLMGTFGAAGRPGAER